MFQKVVEFCGNNCCIKSSICPTSGFCYIVLIFIELGNLQFIYSTGVYFVQGIDPTPFQYIYILKIKQFPFYFSEFSLYVARNYFTYKFQQLSEVPEVPRRALFASNVTFLNLKMHNVKHPISVQNPV